MEKSGAIKLAVKLVLPFVETNELQLDDRKNVDNCAHKILAVIEDTAKGLLEIEKKI